MRRAIVISILVVALIAGWIAAALSLPYQGFPASGVFVEIPRGASARTIAKRLAEKGVIRSRIAFAVLCRWRPHRTLQAGEYFFDRPENAFRVYDKLVGGRVFVATVTVPEGLTMDEIAGLMEHARLTSREEFLQAAADPAPIADLAPGARNLEGFLFPATYQLPHDSSAKVIVQAMTDRFRETWSQLPADAKQRSRVSVTALVTMASLVERETSNHDERPMIAGVFYNRLRRRLPLQCDPTVIYALRREGAYDGTLHPRDLKVDSPYNTYRHIGLPPGPIANPGEASLRAALEPARVNYLYFVANTQGGHFFSRTLAEHNRNVARYRRLLRAEAQEAGGGESRREPPPPNHPPKKRSR